MQWQVQDKISDSDTNKFPEINPIILQLLYNREITTQEQIDSFLTLDYGQDQHDPFLFKDMEKACQRIEEAVKNQENILVHGDYDADGVCSSSLMVTTLKKLGAKNLDIYIPHRETEGYGLNKKTVDYLVEKNINLVITVDCGIANKEEISLAKQKNIDVIVTDHHAQPLELPTDAYALINPQLENAEYPEKELSGAGVAFKVAQALIKRNDLGEAFEKWLLDLVAISMVTDCINLIGESRALTFFGLKVLQQTLRPGLRELVKAAGKELEGLNTHSIGFQIGPRLNAAGRMDHANTAYQLLMTEDTQKAQELSLKLNQTNTQRQTLTEKIMQEVETQVQEQIKEKIFFIQGQDWPLGVVGLVAGKVADKHYRPTLIFTQNQGELTGSGRSIPQFNMIEAIKKEEGFFSRYGGHSQACGFTLDSQANFEEFKKNFKKLAEQELADQKLEKKLLIEAEIKLSEIDWDLISELDKFEPFGEGNPHPLFISRNLKITDCQPVGAQAKHLRLMVQGEGDVSRKMIGFGFGDADVKIGDSIDVVYEIGVNQWNGSQEIQLKVEDLKIR